MFIGELEYGDHPFKENSSFNYIVFALFVFIVVIVVMNLLTTVAILDVTEIKNRSSDDSWFALAMNMNYWEEGLMRLVPYFEYFRRLKRNLYAFSPDDVIVVYPNIKGRQSNRGSRVSRPKTELPITERKLVSDAKKICLERMTRLEEEYGLSTECRETSTNDDVSAHLESIQRRLCNVESRVTTAGRKSARETTM